MVVANVEYMVNHCYRYYAIISVARTHLLCWSFFFTFIYTLVTNGAFFTYPFVLNKHFLAEVSGDSDDGFDEVQSSYFCWFECSTCTAASRYSLLSSHCYLHIDDGMLCEYPSCTFHLFISLAPF